MVVSFIFGVCCGVVFGMVIAAALQANDRGDDR